MTGAATQEVLIVRYGTRTASRNDVFLNYPVYGEPDGPMEMDYFFWVIRGGARTVLVDTGFSQAGGEARGRTMLADPRDILAALGVRPEDEPLVLITHAHYDHIGNLSHFARSPIIIARAEIDFWTGPHGRRAQFHHSVEDSELDDLRAAVTDGRVTTFEDSLGLGDGIEVRRVGGHTPGQAVVLVPTAAGRVLLASDAVHYYEELERDMPFVSASSLVDMYAGFDLIRGLLKDRQIDHLVTGHDPATMTRFPDRSGDLAGAVAVIGAPAGAVT